MNNSTEYEKAVAISAKAIQEFRRAQLAYRARTIGDNEYLAAKKIYDAAMAEYDLAFATEANWTPKTARQQVGGTFGS